MQQTLSIKTYSYLTIPSIKKLRNIKLSVSIIDAFNRLKNYDLGIIRLFAGIMEIISFFLPILWTYFLSSFKKKVYNSA